MTGPACTREDCPHSQGGCHHLVASLASTAQVLVGLKLMVPGGRFHSGSTAEARALPAPGGHSPEAGRGARPGVTRTATPPGEKGRQTDMSGRTEEPPEPREDLCLDALGTPRPGLQWESGAM